MECYQLDCVNVTKSKLIVNVTNGYFLLGYFSGMAMSSLSSS